MGIIRGLLDAWGKTVLQRCQEQALQQGFEEGYNGSPPRMVDIAFMPEELRCQSHYDNGYRMGQQRAIIDKMQGQFLLPGSSGQ